jgi:hypothetical protein
MSARKTLSTAVFSPRRVSSSTAVSSLALSALAFVGVLACSSGGDGTGDDSSGTTPEDTAGLAPGGPCASGVGCDPSMGATSPTPDPALPPPAATVEVPQDGFVDEVMPSASTEPPPPEVNEDNACAGLELVPETIEVEVPTEVTTTMEVLLPVAIYIVLDNSFSMNTVPGEDGSGGIGENDDPNSRWNQAVTALKGFVEDPSSAGIDVALQYFNVDGAEEPPDDDCETDDDCDGFTCNVTVDADGDSEGVCINPVICDGSAHGEANVPVGPLPDNAQALSQSLDDAGPNGNTPTVGALNGGTAYCQAFEAANPDEQCVVVLITDGQPNGCGLSDLCPDDPDERCVDPLAEGMLFPIAEAGLAAGVQTFTVGMDGITPAGFELLNGIAIAGGTDCTPDAAGAEACDVSVTGAQGLIDALNLIRDTVTVTETVTETMTVIETQELACEWGIPDAPEGETFDPMLVNVTLAIDGGPAENIGGVASEADCALSGGYGWYYDNPAAPTNILACPASCAAIEAAMNPTVEVLLGCAIEPPRPPGAR